MLDQGLGDGAGTGPELDDRPHRIRIDILRHGARQRLARRCNRADRERLLDPGADEADFVVEADTFLLLEAAELRLDIAPDLLLDAAERLLDLLFEVLFKELHALFDVLADLLLD